MHLKCTIRFRKAEYAESKANNSHDVNLVRSHVVMACTRSELIRTKKDKASKKKQAGC